MSTITGKTPEAVDADFAPAVISGSVNNSGEILLNKRDGTTQNIGSVGSATVSMSINSSGHLILTKRDGTTQDAGFIGRPLDTRPVGSIYITASSVDPSTIFGGTWARYAKGRVLVGLDEANASFDTVEEYGGEQTHLLTAAETGLRDHGHTASANTQGNHNHGVNKSAGPQIFDGFSIDTTTTQSSWGGMFQDAGAHSHNITVNNSGAYDATTPHNNLQPYTTVYMWKRTA